MKVLAENTQGQQGGVKALYGLKKNLEGASIVETRKAYTRNYRPNVAYARKNGLANESQS